MNRGAGQVDAGGGTLPLLQFDGRDGVVDLRWGHPPPWALPGEEWVAATERAVRSYGWGALTYGHAAGPGPLVSWLVDRLGRIDGRAPGAPEVFVTAGASHALELVCATLLDPGDVVLVGTPTYHLAMRIIADHRVSLVRAPADAEGIDPAATAALVHRLRRAGRRVPLLYLVPTFGNPTGHCLPGPRREALVAAMASVGVTIVEDDTYRELAYGSAAPPSLWSTGDRDGPVVRVSSFSKTVAPGLRLGYLTGPAALVRRLTERGVVDSGGGVNHTVALTMAEFGASGAYERHLTRIVAGYAAQRDVLLAAVRAQLPAARVETPDGGWFLWLRLPQNVRPDQVLDRGRRIGVEALPGAVFGVRRSADTYLRLSFSLYGDEQLTEGVRRLRRAYDEAVEGVEETGPAAI